jgi:predicted ATPase/DNA-binding SARP family transcriptional activator
MSPYSSTKVAAPPILSIQLLGGFRVSVGARTIEDAEWRLNKSKQVVKLLALAPHHALQRDQVQDLLWPDHTLDAATKNFHVALYHARHLLAGDPGATSRYLPLHRGQITLCRDAAYTVDVDLFEVAATTARRTRDLAAYREALKLYTGDLLPEDRYEDWAEQRREDLRRIYLALQLDLAHMHEERGEIEQAIEVLEGLVVSEPLHEQAHARLMRLYARIGQRQHALQLYERLQKALKAELDTVPDVAIEHLYNAIRGGQFPGVPIASAPAEIAAASAMIQQTSRQHNLPVQLSSFVGRTAERAELRRLLTTTRLLTLLGTGGSGKTRLALQVAADLVEHDRSRVWLVELASLSEARLLPQVILNALGIEEEPRLPPLTTLVSKLQTMELLLLLDNCEHLVDGCARVIHTLLEGCPGVRVLSTSRTALRVPGEVLWRVPPLSLPEPDPSSSGADVLQSEAVRLFVERACCREPGFTITAANAEAVVEICRRLDGLPLAIELAAARVGTVPIKQIAMRLDDALALLTGGNRTVLRQRTLRTTLDWSYNLLDQSERGLFDRLSVFVGSWTLEAADAVGGGEDGGYDVLDVLGQLVDQSLVVAETRADGGIRYRMLEPVRQYARQRLEQSGEVNATRRRHALVFLALAEAAEHELTGPQQATWLARMEEEHDNLRAALTWTLESGEAELGLRLAAAIRFFWQMRGHLDEGCRWLKLALANGGAASTPLRAKAVSAAAALAEEQGDYQQAKELWSQGLALWRDVDDRQGISLCLNGLAHVAGYMGDYTTARAMYAESLGLERESGNLERLAITLNDLALVLLLHDGDYAQAMTLLKESLELERQQGNKFGIIMALNNLALALTYQHQYEAAAAVSSESVTLGKELGDKLGLGVAFLNIGMGAIDQKRYDQAVAALQESLLLFQDQGFKLGVAACLEECAAIAAMCRDPKHAARLYGIAETLRQELNAPLWPTERIRYQHYLSIAQQHLSETLFAAAYAEGRNLTFEQAVAEALTFKPTCSSPAPF